MYDEGYYHSFLNRDRLVHIVDPDSSTCEALSVLFRLEGFQTTFSLDAANFYAGLESITSSLLLQSKNNEMISMSYSEAVHVIADSQCHLTKLFCTVPNDPRIP